MRWVIVVLVVGLVAGCNGAGGSGQPVSSEARTVIELPEPTTTGERSLEEALASRRSVREYTEGPLTIDELSQLLWAAQGVTSPAGQRPAPSAGGLYPLETYVVAKDGLYRYVPEGHRLEQIGDDDLRVALADAALGQESVASGAAVFVFAGVYERTAQRYGDRAERYVHLEAGHAAQNLLLQAVALGLGAVPIGAFHDRDVQAVLGLPEDHEPLYLIPVGYLGGA